MTGSDVRSDVEVARSARRRRFLLTCVAVGVATIVLGFGALWASDVLRLDSGPRAALAERANTTTPTDGAGPSACRTPLTNGAPLRLWIGGDSLAGSLGPSLGGQAAATGIVQPVYDSRVSSGLGNRDFFDWPEHATEEMARLNPEIVVFIIGANDWRTPGGTRIDASGAPAWRGAYAAQVEEMLRILEGEPSPAGEVRPVYWIGSPPLQDKAQDAGARDVNAVARTVIATHPEARYIDAYDLFADDGGRYAASLPGPNGRSVRVRSGDGVHFTPDGGDLLAVHVYGPLDARCDLDRQAVPGSPKPVLRTRGSSDGSGTSRTGGTSPTIATSPATVPAPPTAPETAPTPPTPPPAATPVVPPSEPPAPPADPGDGEPPPVPPT
jgi:hypothetical protein